MNILVGPTFALNTTSLSCEPCTDVDMRLTSPRHAFPSWTGNNSPFFSCWSLDRHTYPLSIQLLWGHAKIKFRERAINKTHKWYLCAWAQRGNPSNVGRSAGTPTRHKINATWVCFWHLGSLKGDDRFPSLAHENTRQLSSPILPLIISFLIRAPFFFPCMLVFLLLVFNLYRLHVDSGSLWTMKGELYGKQRHSRAMCGSSWDETRSR